MNTLNNINQTTKTTEIHYDNYSNSDDYSSTDYNDNYDTKPVELDTYTEPSIYFLDTAGTIDTGLNSIDYFNVTIEGIQL